MPTVAKKKYIISVTCESQIEVEAPDILIAEDIAKRNIRMQDNETMKEIVRNRSWWEVDGVEEK